MKARTSLLLVILLACGRGSSSSPGTPPPSAAPESEEPSKPSEPEPEPDPESELESEPVSDPSPAKPALPAAPPDASAAPADAAAAYAACEARLEQPESAGECTSDDDCAPAGCSGERCITRVAAKDLMGTCEVLPCFEVVDTCGCDAGTCRWTLKR